MNVINKLLAAIMMRRHVFQYILFLSARKRVVTIVKSIKTHLRRHGTSRTFAQFAQFA